MENMYFGMKNTHLALIWMKPIGKQKHTKMHQTCKHRSRWILWVFTKIVLPQNGCFIMEHPIKMDDLAVPLFVGNTLIKFINLNACNVPQTSHIVKHFCSATMPAQLMIQRKPHFAAPPLIFFKNMSRPWQTIWQNITVYGVDSRQVLPFNWIPRYRHDIEIMKT